MRDLPPGILVTKRSAALRQIIVAIDQMQKGFYDCAITLAGAAEGMVPDNDKAVHGKIMNDIELQGLADTPYASMDRKQRNAFWNVPRDWLKHQTPQHPPELKIYRGQAEHMIVRALSKLDPTADEIPSAALPLLTWFYTSYSRKTDEEFEAELHAIRSDERTIDK